MKQKLTGWVSILLILLLLFSLTGCTKKDVSGETEQEEEEIKIYPVAVETAETGEFVNTSTVMGTVAANETADVFSKASGKIIELSMTSGQKVNKGDVLIVLDREDIQVQIKQAKAGVDVAKDAKAKAQIQYDNAKLTYERMLELYDLGGVSKQQLEQAEMQMKLLDPSSYDAQIAQAEASLELLNNQLDNCVITAPLSGVVTNVLVKKGDMASPGYALANIISTGTVKVTFSVTAEQVNAIKLGQQLKVLVDAVNGEPMTGTIVSIDPVANQQTKLYPVELELKNEDGLLKPGMFANVTLETDKKADVILVPNDAVMTVEGKTGVYLVKEDIAVFREIVTGLSNNMYTEVVEGMEVGDVYIVDGQYSLEDGDQVTITDRGEN